MRYVIFETGGKQYRAQVGSELEVEKLTALPGKSVKLDRILFLSENGQRFIGRPYVKGAYVEAQVLSAFKKDKVISFKYIRREAGAKTKIGHRQTVTRIKITSIKKG